MRILLVRLRSIGDVVFTTPLLGALRRHFAGAHLTYLVEPAAAPVLEGNPQIDDLMIVPRTRGVARVRDDLRIARRLAKGRFDIAIDLHGGPRSAWFTWASGAPVRVGYTIVGRSWMYTHVVARYPQLLPRHSVMNQWDVLTPLGIRHGDPATDPVRMVVDPQVEGRVAERLAQAGVRPEHRLIVIHVSAGNPFRRWPEAAFVSLVVGLAQRDPARRIVLNSGPSDLDAARRIGDEARRRLGPQSAALVDLGPFGLRELLAISTRAAAFVGGDSGPLHVAATTTVAIVELLGPTLAERSYPWRDPGWFTETIDAGPLPCRPCHQRTCVPGDFRCLTSIGPERVLAAAERALQHASSGGLGPDHANERRMPLAQA